MAKGLKWTLVLGAMVILAAFGVRGAYAAAMGGLAEEYKTAITHSGFAAKYDTMKEVGTHLHHVANCIVGPDDKMFDAGAGNPCQGQGKGIMADLKGAGASDEVVAQAWWLAHMADDAAKMGSVPQAHAAAKIIESQLTNLSKM